MSVLSHGRSSYSDTRPVALKKKNNNNLQKKRQPCIVCSGIWSKSEGGGPKTVDLLLCKKNMQTILRGCVCGDLRSADRAMPVIPGLLPLAVLYKALGKANDSVCLGYQSRGRITVTQVNITRGENSMTWQDMLWAPYLAL